MPDPLLPEKVAFPMPTDWILHKADPLPLWVFAPTMTIWSSIVTFAFPLRRRQGVKNHAHSQLVPSN